MLRNHNIIFDEVPELDNNIKIEINNNIIVNNDSNKNIISA